VNKSLLAKPFRGTMSNDPLGGVIPASENCHELQGSCGWYNHCPS
jgi:hypothetical protein